MHIVQGSTRDPGGRSWPGEWFEQLSAPSKTYVVFDRSGHTPPCDEPARFAAYMRTVADQAETA